MLPPKAYVIEEISQKDSNEQVFRINLDSAEDALGWLKHFEETSNTKFILADGMSKAPTRYIFHKKFACQLSSINKTKNSDRNQDCTSTINILVKKLTKDTKKNDPFLCRDVPLQGVIKFTPHTHVTESADALGLLRLSSETKGIFTDYFSNGHGPGEAIRLHESKLLLEEDGIIKLANRRLNPKPRSVYHLHEVWRSSEFGKAWDSSGPLQTLELKIDTYKKEGTNVIIDNRNEKEWCVLVVTEVMRRAQNLRESSEIIFTDSTSSCDSEQSTITIFLAATKGGAVPIAVMIHNKKTEDGYQHAYQILQKHYPHCFGGKQAPQIFMTDNCSAEKSALKKVWPSALQFLCHFHVGQQEWRWLCDSKHKIPADSRQSLMSMFRTIMYAENAANLETAVKNLEESEYEKYFQRIAKFLETKEEWVKLFRATSLNRGHETNNFAEATIRVLKDIVLCRTKAYNVCALVDFVAHVWNEYFKCKLLHFAYNRNPKARLAYAKLTKKMPADAASKVKKTGTDTYIVPSSKDNESKTYDVNSSVGWCSCPAGSSGAFCKHQTLIYEMFHVGFPNIPPITCKERYELGVLALGDNCPPPSFFLGLKESEEILNEIPDVVLSVDIDLNNDKENDSTPAENITSYLSLDDLQESSFVDTVSHEPSTCDDIDKIFQETLDEMTKIHVLAKQSNDPLYRKTLLSLNGRLSHVQNTSSQALQLFMKVNEATARTVRRGGSIKVQPTAPGRRKEGKTRGSKRIPSGRPPCGEPAAKRTKRRHCLNESVTNNVSHVKKHGDGH